MRLNFLFTVTFLFLGFVSSECAAWAPGDDYVSRCTPTSTTERYYGGMASCYGIRSGCNGSSLLQGGPFAESKNSSVQLTGVGLVQCSPSYQSSVQSLSCTANLPVTRVVSVPGPDQCVRVPAEPFSQISISDRYCNGSTNTGWLNVYPIPDTTVEVQMRTLSGGHAGPWQVISGSQWIFADRYTTTEVRAQYKRGSTYGSWSYENLGGACSGSTNLQ